MNIISPKEFVNTFYKDIFNLLSEKFTRIGTRRPNVFREDVLRVFKQTDKSIKVFNTIAQVTSLPVEELILLLESSVEVAHKIYMDNTKLQGRTYEILRTKANENHSQSREFSNTLSKQAGVIKRQERIISQKNEQIKKFSQEAEKTRSELKKVKSDNNKEPDQQKNSKKADRHQTGENRKKSLRYQYYQNYPRMIQFSRRHVTYFSTIFRNIGAKRTWYDASLGLKGRQERDQWQIVRDLTDEEMKKIKEVGTIKFLEDEFAGKSKAAFIKIIKITKNWKMIGYFYNQKDMEEEVEDSCTKGDMKRIWLIRNKKTIFKEEKKKRSMIILQEKEKKQEETAVTSKKNLESESKGLSVTPPNPTSPATPDSPPVRTYRELGKLTSGKESSMHSPKEKTRQKVFETPDEDEVVEMINKWRLSDSEMEWEKINSQAIEEVTNSFSPKEKKAVEKGLSPSLHWFTRIGQRVIDLAENNDIVRLYTTLNDGFERRLKDENRYQDRKDIRDKRPLFDSPKRSETSGSPSESEVEEEDIKPYDEGG
ncbi:hypothetical protein RhiirA4_427259 [Rhizophagus irregularis]|uniref:Uncharacterized protein n=1 Tax=Rhizophagus irregularis TaxID=588596 RepID=A0A2I1H897_9GLOM|nr:hypothetical protein RhiirA4_427259 [Rhizophagus irregularis]